MSTSDEELPLASHFDPKEYLTPRPQAMDLRPGPELLALFPAMDRRHFYAPAPTDDPKVKEAAAEEREEREISLHACPRNKLQKYTAPAAMDISWPDKQNHRQQFDKDLAAIQAKLSHLTRPIDKFVLETLGDQRLDDEQTEELLAHASDMSNHIQDISHYIAELRNQNIERSLGMEPRKADRTTLVPTNDILERKKLLNSIRRNFNPSHRGRGNGNGRSYSGRNNQQQHYQGNNSGYQQAQQSQQGQTDNSNNRDFYSAQSNSNRGRGRGYRGRGQSTNQQ